MAHGSKRLRSVEFERSAAETITCIAGGDWISAISRIRAFRMSTTSIDAETASD